jgi:hypothetical protein
MYTIIISLHLLSRKHKSTQPCCNTAQKLEKIWTSSMKNSSRGVHWPRSIACGVGVSTAARRESRYSLLYKDNICVRKFI